MATNWKLGQERYLPQQQRGEYRLGGALPSPAAPLSACVHVDNFSHVQAAYGVEIAAELMVELSRILAERMRGAAVVCEEGQGSLRLDASVAAFSGGSAALQTWACLIDEACASFALRPLTTSAGRISIWLSTSLYEAGRVVSIPDHMAAAPFVGEAVGTTARWAFRYRADMALVTAVVDLLDEAGAGVSGADTIALNWQAIRSASGGQAVLYAECLSRTVDGNGDTRSIGPEIAALERTGFVRLFDRYVADLVLAELERHPDQSLGFNISAQSASWDVWWQGFAERLEAAPHVAERLVVEITETASIPDIASAVRFASRLRRLGCRIALDDFGTGHMSLRYLWALSPDIVKIDRLFLARIEHADSFRQAFFHLAKLAQSCGAIVIAEGVETQAQAELAHEMGVTWQQGFHWGKPAFSKCGIGGVAQVPSAKMPRPQLVWNEGRSPMWDTVCEAVSSDDAAAFSAVGALEPETPQEELRVFKGLLFALPLSGLLWLGILRLGGVL